MAVMFDYVRLAVSDPVALAQRYCQNFGFQAVNISTFSPQPARAVHQGSICLILTPLDTDPPGVREVALQVADWAAFQGRLRVMAIPHHSQIHPVTGQPGVTFSAWGNVVHSVFPPHALPSAPTPLGLTAIDHVVLNLPTAQFTQASRWYQALFHWQVHQRFTVNTPHSGLYSEALTNAQGTLRFNLNRPQCPQSQIQTFLDHQGQAGIQHIALATSGITGTVQQLQEGGMDFLTVPSAYYTHQRQRWQAEPFPQPEDWDRWQAHHILFDGQPGTGQGLLQTFTKPLFGVGSFFWEIIQRSPGSGGFGEGNFQALYEAVEQFEQNG